MAMWGWGCGENKSERHEGINWTKGRPIGLCGRRTPVEWSSILHLWKCKSKDRKRAREMNECRDAFKFFFSVSPFANFVRLNSRRLL